MLRWERATVIDHRPGWAGVRRLLVRIDATGETVSALAYPELTGEPGTGEQVLLNTNALRRGLGTGGEAMVVARPASGVQNGLTTTSTTTATSSSTGSSL